MAAMVTDLLKSFSEESIQNLGTKSLQDCQRAVEFDSLLSVALLCDDCRHDSRLFQIHLEGSLKNP